MLIMLALMYTQMNTAFGSLFCWQSNVFHGIVFMQNITAFNQVLSDYLQHVHLQCVFKYIEMERMTINISSLYRCLLGLSCN